MADSSSSADVTCEVVNGSPLSSPDGDHSAASSLSSRPHSATTTNVNQVVDDDGIQAGCTDGVGTDEMFGDIPLSKAGQLKLMRNAMLSSSSPATNGSPCEGDTEFCQNDMLERQLQLVELATEARAAGLSVEQTHLMFGLLADAMDSDGMRDVDGESKLEECRIALVFILPPLTA